MDYTSLNKLLKSLSLFDLYRLRVSLTNELTNPERLYEIRDKIALGQVIEYLDQTTNCIVQAIVLKKTPNKLLVANCHDNEKWWIIYPTINLAKQATWTKNNTLDRNTVKVGDTLGFNHEGHKIVGTVIRLNPKTATLKTTENYTWRVSYNLLFPIIDADKVISVKLEHTE